jgi:hypothetical protein
MVDDSLPCVEAGAQNERRLTREAAPVVDFQIHPRAFKPRMETPAHAVAGMDMQVLAHHFQLSAQRDPPEDVVIDQRRARRAQAAQKPRSISHE